VSREDSRRATKWYQSLILVCIFQEREARGKEHSDTHQMVSELELCLYISSRGRRQSVGDSVVIVCR
jgi:hypothetical protein